MSSLKILNLATHDYGGAGVASTYINDLLSAAGFVSKLMVWDKKSDLNDVIRCRLHSKNPISSKIYRKWARSEDKKWRRFTSDYGFIEKVVFDPQSSYASAKSILSQLGYTPDLILLHWVSYFITPSIINDLKRLTGAKIAWLMLDNSPITGGCHYPFKCVGYQQKCASCPLFKVQNSLAEEKLSLKMKLLPEDLEFWGTSADVLRVRKSALGKLRDGRAMLFPIDESLVSNASKEEVRVLWGIPKDKKIVLVGCTNLNDVRKGGEYLLAILILLKERYPEWYSNISLLLVGDNQAEIFENIGYEVYALGRLPLSELMQAYNAADFFLSTSVEDSGPLMVNHAIASGTPVVSFNIGVAEDLVFNGRTGYKAHLGDVEGLLHCVVDMLSLLEPKGDEVSCNCKHMFKQKSSELSILSCIQAIMSKKE